MQLDEALAELSFHAGTQFDEAVVEAIVAVTRPSLQPRSARVSPLVPAGSSPAL